MPKKLKSLKYKEINLKVAVYKQTAFYNKKSRISSSKRGYNYSWQKARKYFLMQHPLCVHCNNEGIITSANVVDHIEPHKGDMQLFWNKENWQGLCHQHHNKKTATEDGGFGNKTRG